MLCRIAFYQEVYALKSSQIGIRLRKCKVKTISKGTHTAIYVFYDVMCQVHITSFSCKYTPRFRQYQIFGGFSLRNRKKLRGKTKISLDICSFWVFFIPFAFAIDQLFTFTEVFYCSFEAPPSENRECSAFPIAFRQLRRYLLPSEDFSRCNGGSPVSLHHRLALTMPAPKKK